MPTIEASPGGIVYVAPGSGIKDWSWGIELVRRWPKAEQIYDRILKATGVDIIAVCDHPKGEPPTKPEETQPAALGIGYASSDFLRHEVGPPDCVMGLSAGEFTAVAINGSVILEDAAKAAQQRGASQIQEAGGKGGSAMVLHTHRGRRAQRKLIHTLNSIPGVHVSNYHTDFKIGIGYTTEAYEQGLEDEVSLIAGVRRLIHNREVPFPPHGKDLAKTQEMLASLFERIHVKDGIVPVMANKTGRLMQKAATVEKNLVWQTTSPTQLHRGMAYLISKGVEDFYDIGPDNVMQKLLGDFVTLHGIKVHSAADI